MQSLLTWRCDEDASEEIWVGLAMEVEIDCIWGLECIEVSRSFGEDLPIGRTAFVEAQDKHTSTQGKVGTQQNLFSFPLRRLIHRKM